MGWFTASIPLLGNRIRFHLFDPVILAVAAWGIAQRSPRSGDDERAAALILFCGAGLGLMLHAAIPLQACRLMGVRVRQLTVGLFGSALIVDDATSGPRRELAIAACGIVTATATAIAAGVVALVWAPAEPLAIAAGTFLVVQLLPSLPLDAGRALRAAAWPIVDSPVTAARATHRYGLLFCGLALVFGVALLDRTGADPFWGLLGLAAAIELAIASFAMLRDFSWQDRGRQVTLRESGATTVTVIDAGQSIDTAVEMLLALGDAALLVTGGTGPIGAVDRAQVRRVSRSLWHDRTVREVMTPLTTLPLLDPDLSVFDAVDLLDEQKSVLGRTLLGNRPALVTRGALRGIDQRRSTAVSRTGSGAN